MIGKQFVFRWWGLPKCNNWFGFCIFLCWWEVNPPNIFVVFCFYFSYKLSPSVFFPLSAPFPWFIKSALNSTWMQENQSALNSTPLITRKEGGGEGKRWSSNLSNSGFGFRSNLFRNNIASWLDKDLLQMHRVSKSETNATKTLFTFVWS